MENVIVFIISIIFIIIGIAFGGFKDGYPQKIARKKATEVKRLIEFNDPSPVLTPINSVPEVVDDTSTNVKALLGENDF